ncbi:hypothetical protein C7E12_21250, partial [Stenotrophomonas maltophilia]
EVPLPLRRTVTDAVDSTLVVTFQGCQTDGICYRPRSRIATSTSAISRCTSTRWKCRCRCAAPLLMRSTAPWW